MARDHRGIRSAERGCPHHGCAHARTVRHQLRRHVRDPRHRRPLLQRQHEAHRAARAGLRCTASRNAGRATGDLWRTKRHAAQWRRRLPRSGNGHESGDRWRRGRLRAWRVPHAQSEGARGSAAGRAGEGTGSIAGADDSPDRRHDHGNGEPQRIDSHGAGRRGRRRTSRPRRRIESRRQRGHPSRRRAVVQCRRTRATVVAGRGRLACAGHRSARKRLRTHQAARYTRRHAHFHRPAAIERWLGTGGWTRRSRRTDEELRPHQRDAGRQPEQRGREGAPDIPDRQAHREGQWIRSCNHARRTGGRLPDLELERCRGGSRHGAPRHRRRSGARESTGRERREDAYPGGGQLRSACRSLGRPAVQRRHRFAWCVRRVDPGHANGNRTATHRPRCPRVRAREGGFGARRACDGGGARRHRTNDAVYSGRYTLLARPQRHDGQGVRGGHVARQHQELRHARPALRQRCDPPRQLRAFPGGRVRVDRRAHLAFDDRRRGRGGADEREGIRVRYAVRASELPQTER